jgi:tetratricopeptide (TPR) repeat protein
MGNLEKAIDAEKKSMEVYSLCLAKNIHSPLLYKNIALSLLNVGGFYTELKQALIAVDYFDEAISFLRKITHEKEYRESFYEILITAYNRKALLFIDARGYEVAKSVLDQMFDTWKTITVPERGFGNKIIRELFEAYRLYAIAEGMLENADKAISLLLHAIKLREEFSHAFSDKASFALCYEAMASNYKKLGLHQQAFDNYKKACDVLYSETPVNYACLSPVLNNAGLAYYEVGEYEIAFEILTAGVNNWSLIKDGNTANLSELYNNLGITLCELGDYALSIETHQNALEIREADPAFDQLLLAQSYSNISQPYYYLQKNEIALVYINKAVVMRSALLPAGHANLENSIRWKQMIEEAL